MNGVVSSGSIDTSRAGGFALQQGGNAIDAMIADDHCALALDVCAISGAADHRVGFRQKPCAPAAGRLQWSRQAAIEVPPPDLCSARFPCAGA